MSHARLFLVPLLLAAIAGQGLSWYATIFDEPSFKGNSMVLSNGGCSNVPDNFTRLISSINTWGTCLVLYDARECTGRSIQLYPGTPSHGALDVWSFDKTAESIGSCDEFCVNCEL